MAGTALIRRSLEQSRSLLARPNANDALPATHAFSSRCLTLLAQHCVERIHR